MKIIKLGQIMMIGLCFAMQAFAEQDTTTVPITPFKADFSAWSQLESNIKTCTPGTFNLPDPSEIMLLNMAMQVSSQNRMNSNAAVSDIHTALKNAIITYDILGESNGKCNVVIIKKVNYYPAAPQITQIHCAFTEVDIAGITRGTKEIVKGNYEVTANDPMTQAISRACK